MREENEHIYHVNIKSNQINIEAINLYESYLNSQKNNILGMNNKLAEDLSAAENIYRTVTLSHSIAFMLKNGSKNFDTLLKLSAPKLVRFTNKEVEIEF